MKSFQFTLDQAIEVGNSLGIDWNVVDKEQFFMGINVELEHGLRDPETNVTDNDPLMTGKIAWAHLKEIPDYYSRLEKMESDSGY